MASQWGRVTAAINKVTMPLAATKAGGWMFTHVLYKVDLPLMHFGKLFFLAIYNSKLVFKICLQGFILLLFALRLLQPLRKGRLLLLNLRE